MTRLQRSSLYTKPKIVVSLKSLIRLFALASFLAIAVALFCLQRHSQQESSHPWNSNNNLLSLSHEQYLPNDKTNSLSTVLRKNPETLEKEKRTVGNTVTAKDLGLTFEKDGITVEEAKRDKEPILQLLLDAGIEYLDLPTLAQLPTWSTVRKLYGDGPVIQGLDTCTEFRNKVPPESASMGPAGIFNSGTNILYTLLESNCYFPQNKDTNWGMKWQVPWGKHMLASRRLHNTVEKEQHTNKDHVLPIVVTRDPYTWMQSMCKHPYSLMWHHSSQHCPNLVPNQYDYRLYHFSGKNIPVRIKKWKTKDFPTPIWNSMAHLWTDWYQQYLVSKEPRIMMRLEDLIFYPKQVITAICDCAGGEAINKDDKFNYFVDSAKFGSGHGQNKTSLIGAMIKYGSEANRIKGYTSEDLVLAHDALDSELMNIFQYKKAKVP